MLHQYSSSGLDRYDQSFAFHPPPSHGSCAYPGNGWVRCFFVEATNKTTGGWLGITPCRHPPPTNPRKTAPKKPWSSRPSQWLLLHLRGLKMPCDDQFESTSPRCNCHDSTHLEGFFHEKRLRKKNWHIGAVLNACIPCL